MTNEPLVLSEILARLPAEADFDAAHAALMATTRGREFLAEHARRNRNADTQWLVSALQRVEAALRGEPAPRPDSVLSEIAWEIERIETGLAGGKTVDDISAALERVHDVAFMLHERPVEPSLRDAFDGAIRQLSDALTQPAGMVERTQKAIVQLRALAERLQAMIAPASVTVQQVPLSDGSRGSVAEAHTVSAGSLPAETDASTSETNLADNHKAVVEDQSGVDSIEAEPAKETGPVDGFSSVESFTGQNDRAEEVCEAPPDLPPPSENVLDQAFDSDAFARIATASQSPSKVPLPATETLHEDTSSGEPPSEQLLPSQVYSETIIAGPQEDPGDLFEPMPVPTPVPTLAVDQEQISGQKYSPQYANITSATRLEPHVAASDPLAAVRDLSEEELIALFS